MLIDTHAHLDFPEFDQDRNQVIERAKAAGVEYIVNIGSSLKGSSDSLKLAGELAMLFAAVGLHPHEADNFNDESYARIKTLASDKKVVAIGEIGLDYFKNYSSPQNQRTLFTSLLVLSQELDLPVVLHCRQAEEDLLTILKKAMPRAAVVHCFSGDKKFLEDCLDLGFFVSFTCNITYKKAQGLRGLIREVPLEKLFLETDCPFLPPEGQRGKRNEPANVKRLCDEIASIKGIGPQQVAEVTSQNAIKFFSLK